MSKNPANYLLSQLIILLFSNTTLSHAEKYLTIEERNRLAREDAMKMAEEMRKIALESQDGEIAPTPEIDFSQYNIFWDFKNVFFGVSDPDGWDWLSYEQSSSWKEKERVWSRESIKKRKYDWVVLPVEDFTVRNDLISRMLSAEYIAADLRRKTGLTTMPIEPLLTYLGNSQLLFYSVSTKF